MNRIRFHIQYPPRRSARDALPVAGQGVTRGWPKAHDDLIREEFPTGCGHEIGMRIGRSERAVQRRASELGVRKDPAFTRSLRARRALSKPTGVTA